MSASLRAAKSADKADAFQVAPKALHFLGAYKYKVIDRSLGEILKLTPEQYGLNPVKAPNEAAVLRLLQDKVQDPRWKERIKARLAKLGR